MNAGTIRFNMVNNQRWLERGILAIDNRQTSDEKADRTTKYDNGRGWNASDAKTGSYLASYIRRSTRPEGQRLSGPWIAKAREIMRKYARQLSRVVQERQAA